MTPEPEDLPAMTHQYACTALRKQRDERRSRDHRCKQPSLESSLFIHLM
jgi:hypothetical protein